MATVLMGEVERVTYENEETGFRVLRVRSLEGRTEEPVVVVGTFRAVGPGTRVRVTGQFTNDPRHGRQFRAEALVPVVPDTLVGLERYLGSGLVPGIGPALAKRIVSRFGMDSLRVLDLAPDRLGEVPGIGARRVEDIKKTWAAERAVSNVMLLLQTHGASPSLAARIWKHYGKEAAEIIERAPYRLAMDVQGIGFKTADRMAQSLGIAGDHPERVQAGVLHTLESFAEQGHVCAERELLRERAAEMLEVGADHVDAAIDAVWARGRVVVEESRVFLSYLHKSELELAQSVVRLLRAPGKVLGGLEERLRAFEQRAKLELAPAQQQAVGAAAKHKVLVITGGPGVGKTTLIRAIVDTFEGARLKLRLAAPTGRAGKRLMEATGREASTLHRLLGYEPRAHAFQFNTRNPLEADAVIVDEASMIDLPLAAALFAALPSHARLVVVGDADQLPSVGPGAVLRDLLGSGVVPCVRLTEVFRQAAESRIVQNAHRILHGEMPEGVGGDDPRPDFFVVARRDAEEAAKLVQELVTQRIPKRFGLNPREDVQVLTPMHRGASGTEALNERLQAALNPEGPALQYRGHTFREGDKVMQVRNDYDREVFNGDVGVIATVDVEKRSVSVRFEQRTVDYDDTALEALTLAYAISIHKSQGSEYPAVVIPLLTAHFVMLSRNLLYTAVTRAKRLCVLVADPRALSLAVSETRREERATQLAERLRRSLPDVQACPIALEPKSRG